MICSVCNEDSAELECTECGSPALLAERYRLDAVLGYGSRGVTYWAFDQQLERSVAIKALHLHAGRDNKADELARREGAILRQLDHPQIPKLFDVFELGRGRARTLYVVQEHKPGLTLEQELEVRRYTVSDVLVIMRGVLETLSYLHSLSPPVVHRDIKPANIIRGPGNVLHLVDFGSVADELPGRTFGGSTVAGTFGFMAPEQFRGDAFPASDIYAVGALAVALLTRKPPHHFLDWSGKLQWRDRVSLTPEVSTLLSSMLLPTPELRPSSAEVTIRWIDDILSHPRGQALHTTGLPTPDEVSFQAPAPLPHLKVTVERGGDVGRSSNLFQQITGPRAPTPVDGSPETPVDDAGALSPLLQRMRQLRSKVVIDD